MKYYIEKLTHTNKNFALKTVGQNWTKYLKKIDKWVFKSFIYYSQYFDKKLPLLCLMCI